MCAAAYDNVDGALTDLDAIELAHMHEMIGQYDAAVLDKRDGKPHVVKRMDRPHIRIIPERFGDGPCPVRSSTRPLSSSPPARPGSSWSASLPWKKGWTRR